MGFQVKLKHSEQTTIYYTLSLAELCLFQERKAQSWQAELHYAKLDLLILSMRFTPNWKLSGAVFHRLQRSFAQANKTKA